jgi:SpoVK/Ycf46/Vps4 family AAA+-type ATPase
MWGLPLLRLDMGALYNKYIGETERNLRECLVLAERMAPCVLWFDEIEKGIADDGQENGTSRRLLGSLLNWMAEKTARVFIVATANDIERLPPELIRKGRLDEIFFVDLPDEAVRRTIFEIHLKKRYLDPALFDLAQLSLAAEGFSGAEIEQSVVAALYSCAADNVPLSTATLLYELANTSPLSVVMAEKVDALRQWAAQRTVLADGE